MIETAEGIPEFQDNGYLPHKCYEVTLEEIKEKLVDSFPNSKTRASRFDCFIRFYKELLDNVKCCRRLLIDGSFVEDNCNPNDIDFTIVIDGNFYNNDEKFYINTEFKFKNILREEFKLLKETEDYSLIYESDFFKYGCDFFPLVKEDVNSIDYVDYVAMKKYWIKQWGHDRKNIEKGFLNLKVNYGDDLDGL